MPVGDIYRVTVGTWCLQQSGINVLFYRTTVETGTGATQAEIAGHFDPIFAVRYKALMASDATYYGVKVGRIFPDSPLLPVVASANVGAGTFGAAVLPMSITGVITKRTNYAGRKYRGRVYVPFPAESANDDDTGNPNAGYMTVLQLLGDVLDDDQVVDGAAGDTTLEPILYRKAGNAWVSLVTCVGQMKWGTQRRRGSYGNQNAYPPL